MKRIFGVIKQHLQIFKSILEYNFITQIYLVFNITNLYNFIYKYQSQKNMYNRKKLLLKREDRKKDSEDNIEIRANLAKRDRKKNK